MARTPRSGSGGLARRDRVRATCPATRRRRPRPSAPSRAPRAGPARRRRSATASSPCPSSAATVGLRPVRSRTGGEPARPRQDNRRRHRPGRPSGTCRAGLGRTPDNRICSSRPDDRLCLGRGHAGTDRPTAGAHWTRARLRGRFLSLVSAGPESCGRPRRPAPPRRPSLRRNGAACTSPAHATAGLRGRPSATPAAAYGQGELALAGDSIDLAAWEPAGARSDAAPRLLIGSGHGTAWTSSPLPCPSRRSVSRRARCCAGYIDPMARLPGSGQTPGSCSFGRRTAGRGLGQDVLGFRSGRPGLRARRKARAAPTPFGHPRLCPDPAQRPLGHQRRRTPLVGCRLGGPERSHVGIRRHPRRARRTAMPGWRCGPRWPNHVALFHTTDGGSSWLSPVLGQRSADHLPGRPPRPANPVSSSSTSTGPRGQREAGSPPSTSQTIRPRRARSSRRPRSSWSTTMPTNERTIAMTMPSTIAVDGARHRCRRRGSGRQSGDAAGQRPAVVAEPAQRQPALLGGDGADVCPVPLFTPSVAQMDFRRGLGLVSPHRPWPTPANDYGIAPIEPICGWQVQAQVSVVQGP